MNYLLILLTLSLSIKTTMKEIYSFTTQTGYSGDTDPHSSDVDCVFRSILTSDSTDADQ